MIKLVFTDIDGTLVGQGQENLNPEYYAVINQLFDQGVQVAVATGRHSVSVHKLFRPVLDKIWILSQNGAVMERDGYSKVLKPIPRDYVIDFWKDLSSFPENESILDTATCTYSPFEGTEMYNLIRGEGYNYNLTATGGWDRIPEETFSMITVYDPEDAEAFCKQHLYDKWQGKLNMSPTGQTWVDCTMPGISKGNALQELCNNLGVAPEDTIAFGDQINDISMLELAGTGYAVENARPEVKEKADYVIPGYAEDGVLQVLKMLL